MALRSTTKRVASALALIASISLGISPDARADGLTPDQSARLARGESLVFPQTWESNDGARYIGGVTYTIVDASASELAAIFEDVGAYRRLLPRTKQARRAGTDGTDFFIELLQGNSVFETQYTLRVRPIAAVAGGGREFRFWLDRASPHGIEDAWGYFRCTPVASATGAARTLLTYAAVVDVGPGIVRELFEERLRGAMLSVPHLLRRYVAELHQPRAAARPRL